MDSINIYLYRTNFKLVQSCPNTVQFYPISIQSDQYRDNYPNLNQNVQIIYQNKACGMGNKIVSSTYIIISVVVGNWTQSFGLIYFSYLMNSLEIGKIEGVDLWHGLKWPKIN